jgi:hypothetical protein
MRTVAAVASRFTWSPAVYRDRYRSRANFLYADVLGLDFDGLVTLEQATNEFCDRPHVIGTTRNHRIEKDGVVADRFRVIFRLERPCLDIYQYEYMLKRYIDRYDADAKCSDASRQFFPCDIVSVSDEGEPEVLLTAPTKADRKAASDAQIKARVDAGCLTRDALRLLHGVIPVGERNNAYFRGIKDLAKAGLTEAQVTSLLHDHCQTQKTNPLSDREIETTMRSAFASARKDMEAWEM